jgi:carbonic anhydrase
MISYFSYVDACLDMRVDPEAILGLKPGGKHVVKIPGKRNFDS